MRVFTRIMNLSFTIGEVPTCFKIAKVTPLIKKKTLGKELQAILATFCPNFWSFSFSCHSFQRQRSYHSCLTELHWLHGFHRIRYKCLLLVFKTLNEHVPVSLDSILLPYTPSRTFQSSSQVSLGFPSQRPRKSFSGKRGCATTGPSVGILFLMISGTWPM